MMKKLICALLAVLMLLSMTACGPKKTVHCDACGEAVEIEADSNMTDEWIIYCGPCNEELFGDNPVVSPG